MEWKGQLYQSSPCIYAAGWALRDRVAGFLGSSVVKNPPANAADTGNAGSIPGSGRSPGGGHGPVGYSPWVAKNQTQLRD